MGEYEPNDSRKVTQSDHRAPGEPPRTGPREDEARRKAKRKDPDALKKASEPQHKVGEAQQWAEQAQQHERGAQSQSQSQSSLRGGDASPGASQGNPDAQEMQGQPGGPSAGNQPQAIDNPAGASKPHYDQHELNQPQNMHRHSADEEARMRDQAGRQDGRVGGFGYGADGGEEMQDAPDKSAEGGNAPGAELRGYGGRGEAARADRDKR